MVVALLVSLTVALSGIGRQAPPLVAAAPVAAVPEVDMRSIEGMISRFAAAVEGSGEYPPAAEWRVSLAVAGSYTDPVIIVDDAFACRLTPVGGIRAARRWATSGSWSSVPVWSSCSTPGAGRS